VKVLLREGLSSRKGCPLRKGCRSEGLSSPRWVGPPRRVDFHGRGSSRRGLSSRRRLSPTKRCPSRRAWVFIPRGRFIRLDRVPPFRLVRLTRSASWILVPQGGRSARSRARFYQPWGARRSARLPQKLRLCCEQSRGASGDPFFDPLYIPKRVRPNRVHIQPRNARLTVRGDALFDPARGPNQR
jgi:hypothetical protein